jgi:S1-C subfamily serine protease
LPASNPSESDDLTHYEPPDTDLNSGADSPLTPPAPDFTDQQTATYAPPPEPRNSWAPAGWSVQTPPHWFEPIPEAQPVKKQSRGGSFILPLFVVALIAAIVGSLVTVGALMATNHFGQLAAVVAPSPTPLVPLPSGAEPASSAQPDSNDAITLAAQKVSPSVVTITVKNGGDASPQPDEGIGSGIIYDSGGYVLTNRHVVTDATDVSVELNDGRTVDGTVYGVDTLTDLAIVKVDATDLPAAPIGDSSQLQPGQTAIVIGSPLGTFTNSVTSGVVSALGRSLVVTDPVNGQQRRLRNLIQTDAAINPGNSGGPLIDQNGDVVGVSTAYAQDAQGIFFAIPINIAKPIMAQAVAGQQLTRPYLGIIYQAVDKSVADENKLPIDYGAWISPDTGTGDPPIVPGSPAEKAGLQAGDIITSVDGHRVDAGAGLDDVLSLYSSGDTLTLQVLRNGQTVPITVTLGTRPAGLD